LAAHLKLDASDLAADLLARMLDLNPTTRISAAAALKHPFLQPSAAEDQSLAPEQLPYVLLMKTVRYSHGVHHFMIVFFDWSV
jgi:serine/threonine protein kinase